MNPTVSWWQSLKTRATVWTLAVFVLGIWALSLWVSRNLQADMERLLGEQQLSVVTAVAQQVNQEMANRTQALHTIASEMDAGLLRNPAALQARLDQRLLLPLLFNGGAFVTGLDGTAIADVPHSANRVGTNYMERDFMVAALQHGQATVGRPVVGKQLHAPLFAMAVPVRDAQGKVIGALVGVTNLGEPSFLDTLKNNPYGKTGGYLLIHPQSRQIITATDPKRIMEVLPAPGIHRYVDRNIAGYEGYSVLVNALGEDQLASIKQLPAWGWYILLGLPTAEAFAPMHDSQRQLLWATLWLTLLTGALTWWILKRQLSPLVETANAMVALADTHQLARPLPEHRPDEMGRLINGFNRMLIQWASREATLMDSQQSLAITLNSIGDAVIATDTAGRITRMNPAAERLTGWPLATAMGQPLTEVFAIANADTRQPVANPVQRVMEGGEVVGLANHTVLRARDGREYQIADSAAPIRNAAHQIVGVVLVFSDVTDRYQAEESLRIAATAFEIQQGMYITNAQRVILRINKACTHITGYSAEEAVGQTPALFDSDRADSDHCAAVAQATQATGTWSGELWLRRKDGEVYPAWLNISAVKDDAGQTTHFVSMFSDITERIQAQEQINTLAFYDPLTQLPNRRLLLDRLDQSLLAGTRHARKSALLFIDLDNFKTLNDTRGHQQGDLLLTQVAQRIKACVRDGDTLARLGSDEFVVMLEDLSEDAMDAATQAETVAHNVLQAFQPDFALDQGPHHSTPSIGITLFGGTPLEGSDQPLRRAELAMFQAKAAGRNTLCFFEAQMQAEVSAQATLEAELRAAVQQQQLVLHYQPQVVGAGRITGVEALVRWQHPQHGMVSPAQFIPLAEESGLILPIGQWVLETSCAQLAAWASQPDLAHLSMAVNVSARQFSQPDFVDTVLATLDRTGASPKHLKLELTESMLVNDVAAVIAKMDALKARGVTFSLDDFGTGYSSLAYLKRLPLDQLKIDQGFVRHIVTDTNDAAIAKMVVVLAESMGLSVIAEGVESQAQVDLLAHLGCHAYQGYMFSRPLALPALEALVRQAAHSPNA